MKRVGVLPGLVLAVTGLAHAAMDEQVAAGDPAANAEAGNEYMVPCTETGIAEGLSGDELDAYIEDCMTNPYASQEESTGEDS